MFRTLIVFLTLFVSPCILAEKIDYQATIDVAEPRHDTGVQVLPHWQRSLQIIDNNLANAIYNYRTGDQQQALADIRTAQFSGFKNSDLETAIRLHRSAQQSAAYNQAFTTLLERVKQPDQLVAIGYEITRLIQDISDDLPDLPATRDYQTPDDQTNKQEIAPAKNWQQVTISIAQSIQQAISLYQADRAKQAIMIIQDSYFDQFEASGMENAIGARDASFKATIDGYFTRMVSMMKAQSQPSEISEQARRLNQDLNQSVSMLSQQGQGFLAIAAGFIIGLIALLVIYIAMRYTVVRLPLKPFFMFTGSFMYLMAFVFAGNGMLELIEAKLFEPTLLPNIPQISSLGIHPYLETLAPQAALVVAALIALGVMKRRNQGVVLETRSASQQ